MSPHHRGGGARLGRPWPDGWDGCCDTVTCPWRLITLGAAIEAVKPRKGGHPQYRVASPPVCKPVRVRRRDTRGVQVELLKWVFDFVWFFGFFFSSKAAGS